MSEYQYYEFLAKDRLLTDRQMAALRRQSTRATITRTGFINEYNFGDLKGSPVDWMRRYFDAHLYAANWGTRVLMFRIPSNAVDGTLIKRYLGGQAPRATASARGFVVTFRSESEDSDSVEGPSGVLASVEPVRDEIAAGDYRALYLGWLLRVQQEELSPSVREPPCPPGLDALSPTQEALVDFMRIDRKLIGAAAERSESWVAPSDAAAKRKIRALAVHQKNRLLFQLLVGEHATARAELLSATRPRPTPAGPARSVADLVRRAEEPRSARTAEPSRRPRRKVRAVAKGANGAPSRATRRREEVQDLMDRLAEEICREEGRGIGAIAAALGVTTRELARPVRKLIAEGRIRARGVKRATTYYGPKRRGRR